MMTDAAAVLDEAYYRLHRHGPEFGGDEEGNHGLTNHGPMAAEVIVRRGLDVDLLRWLDNYVRRLEELPTPSDRITAETWHAALGDGRRIGDWTEYFSRRLAEASWTEVLVTWWPRLLPGIAAGSTHGVIRVGHAVRSLRRGVSASAITELGYGLAFWAARSRTLPGFTAPAGTLPPAEALAVVPRLADQSGLIAHRLGRLADLAGWPNALAALRAPATPAEVPALLEELVETAAVHYLTHGQGSPVLLVHTATAPNAVRHVLPVLPEEMWIGSLAAAWAASAAITATYSPAEPLDSQLAPPSGSDPAAEVLDRAAWHRDEHVIKFADTAVEVFERTGNAAALAAALRVGQLIDSSAT